MFGGYVFCCNLAESKVIIMYFQKHKLIINIAVSGLTALGLTSYVIIHLDSTASFNQILCQKKLSQTKAIN